MENVVLRVVVPKRMGHYDPHLTMCNKYEAPQHSELELHFKITGPLPDYPSTVVPLRSAPIIVAPGRALVGQWGMIPPRSLTRRPMMKKLVPAKKGSAEQVVVERPMSTNNARRERLATAMTYRGSWANGRRCLIPALSYDEPYWGDTGFNTWWRFQRADGAPWALAGLWSEWTDPVTGEVVPNFSMITQNCDGHPLLSLMHKPDPKLPDDKQDKRAVVPIEPEDWALWLDGSVADAEALIQLPQAYVFDHGPADPASQVLLPL